MFFYIQGSVSTHLVEMIVHQGYNKQYLRCKAHIVYPISYTFVYT